MQVIVQGPLTVPILGLGSQRWRRNEIMLFLISSAKKIFHLLPVRDARFSNKKMAVSLTSSCSCGNRRVTWVSLLFRPFPVSAPHPPSPPCLAKEGWNPDTGALQPQPLRVPRILSLSQQLSYLHYMSLNDCGSGV